MSPHRSFFDDENNNWSAWDVIPSWGERRVRERRQRDLGPPPDGERRIADRRRIRGIRIALTPSLAGGWLAFESGDSRRRMVPIPVDWHTLPDEDLRALLRAAEPLPRRRKRLIE